MTLVPAVIAATSVERAGSFSREDLDTLRRTICHDLNDAEFELFAAICRRTGLDPVAKQIYAVKRYDGRQKREVMQVQTSIDGFRVIAERSGNYAGPAPTFWCGSDGVWRDVWLSPEPPAAAKAGVYRRDFTEPVYAVAKFASYCARNKDGSPQAMWRTMPEVMIAKCAESLAIRRAFPNDVAGVYTREEMAQADHRAAVPTKVVGEVSGVSVPPDAATSPAPPAPGGGADSPDLAVGSQSARASEEQDATPSGPATRSTAPAATTRVRALESGARSAGSTPADDSAAGAAVTSPVPVIDSTKSSAAKHCFAIARSVLDSAEDVREAQWDALVYQESGGRTTSRKELTEDEWRRLGQRMKDLSMHKGSLEESDHPDHMGWTITWKEAT